MSLSYILRKVATFLALPLGLTMLLLALAAVFRNRRLAAAALVLVYLSSVPVVSNRLLGVLEGTHPRLSVEACPASDAVVVLGGVVGEWDGSQGVEWSEAVDRFEYGVRLYQAGKAPRLVLSGGLLPSGRTGRTEGDAMRQAALGRGVPEKAIRVVRGVSVTADEARAVEKLAESEGFRKLILVTSAFHTARALYLFERAGLEATPFPVDYQARREPFTAMALVPQADSLVKTEILLKEIYGLLYYRLGGAW